MPFKLQWYTYTSWCPVPRWTVVSFRPSCHCGQTDTHLLPPTNEVAGSWCFQSCLFVSHSVRGEGRWEEGSRVIITHDVLELTVQPPPDPTPPLDIRHGGHHRRSVLQTCSLEAYPTSQLVLTSGGNRSTYGWQAGGTRPTCHSCTQLVQRRVHSVRYRNRLTPWPLPPANEVWGKVIFSQARVSHSVRGGGGVSLYNVTSCLAVWSHVPSGGSLFIGSVVMREEWGTQLCI